MAVALGDRAKGSIPGDRTVRLAPWITTWLDGFRADQARPTTMRSHRSKQRCIARDPLGRKRVTEIRPSDVEAFLRRRSETVSRDVVAQFLTFIRSALDAAVREQIVSSNVARVVRGPRYVVREAAMPTADQLAAIRTATAGTPLGNMVDLALGTGMRQGELLALKWRQVDLHTGIIRVEGTLDQTTDCTVGPPKSARSLRKVALDAPMVAVLRRHADQTVGVGLTPFPDGWVFPDERHPSRPWKGQKVLQRIQAICHRAGLPSIRFHDLRHVAATRMALDPRNNLDDVARFLGHSPAMLARTYVHRQPGVVHLGNEQLG